MVYTHKELKKKYGSDYQINKAVKEGKLYKIESGIYSDKQNNHYLDIFVKKYPNAIISGDSAYYYHNLTDVIKRNLFSQAGIKEYGYSVTDSVWQTDDIRIICVVDSKTREHKMYKLNYRNYSLEESSDKEFLSVKMLIKS